MRAVVIERPGCVGLRDVPEPMAVGYVIGACICWVQFRRALREATPAPLATRPLAPSRQPAEA